MSLLDLLAYFSEKLLYSAIEPESPDDQLLLTAELELKIETLWIVCRVLEQKL